MDTQLYVYIISFTPEAVHSFSAVPLTSEYTHMQANYNYRKIELCIMRQWQKKTQSLHRNCRKSSFPLPASRHVDHNLPTAQAASVCQMFTPVLPLATDALGQPSGTGSRARNDTAELAGLTQVLEAGRKLGQGAQRSWRRERGRVRGRRRNHNWQMQKQADSKATGHQQNMTSTAQ